MQQLTGVILCLANLNSRLYKLHKRFTTCFFVGKTCL